MQIPINLASLLLTPGAVAQGTPASGGGLFSQTLAQQLLGTSSSEANPNPNGLWSASLLNWQGKNSPVKAASTQAESQAVKSQTPAASDITSIDPLLAGLLSVVLSEQTQPPAQNFQNPPTSATSGSKSLKVGTGTSANTLQSLQALHQVLTALVQQPGPGAVDEKDTKSTLDGNAKVPVVEKDILASNPVDELQKSISGPKSIAADNGTHQTSRWSGFLKR